MRSDAYLINTSRGPVIDQAALREALEAGAIAGAALDVLEVEPPDPADPLPQLANVIVLPHIGTATEETRYLMRELAVNNVLAVLAGEMPPAIREPRGARLAQGVEPCLARVGVNSAIRVVRAVVADECSGHVDVHVHACLVLMPHTTHRPYRLIAEVQALEGHAFAHESLHHRIPDQPLEAEVGRNVDAAHTVSTSRGRRGRGRYLGSECVATDLTPVDLN